MSFQTGSSSIDLSGPPWNVTHTVELYVKRDSAGNVFFYRNAHGSLNFWPVELEVPHGVSTGLYFYILDSGVDMTFCDGAAGLPLPIVWLENDVCPTTVTYGKIRADRLAFSIKDLCQGQNTVSHSFDIMVQVGNLPPFRIFSASGKLTGAIDPTIVEVGEEPPSP